MQQISFVLLCMASMSCGLRVQFFTKPTQNNASTEREKKPTNMVDAVTGVSTLVAMQSSDRRAGKSSASNPLNVFARLLCAVDAIAWTTPSSVAFHFPVRNFPSAGSCPLILNGWNHRSTKREVVTRVGDRVRMLPKKKKETLDIEEAEEIEMEIGEMDDVDIEEIDGVDEEISGELSELRELEEIQSEIDEIEQEMDLDDGGISSLETKEGEVKSESSEGEGSAIDGSESKDVQPVEELEVAEDEVTEAVDDDAKTVDEEGSELTETEELEDMHEEENAIDFAEEIVEAVESTGTGGGRSKKGITLKKVTIPKKYERLLLQDEDESTKNQWGLEDWEEDLLWDEEDEDEDLGRRTPDPTYREKLISPEYAWDMLNNETYQLTLLDLRSRRQHCLGRVPNSVSMPAGVPSPMGMLFVFKEGFEPEVIARFGEDTPVMLMCELGTVGRIVAYRLHKAGHRSIRIMRGGFQGFSEAGLPIEEGIPDLEEFKGINPHPTTFEEIWSDWPEDHPLQPFDIEAYHDRVEAGLEDDSWDDDDEDDEEDSVREAWDDWEDDVVGGDHEDRQRKAQEKNEKFEQLEALMASLDAEDKAVEDALAETADNFTFDSMEDFEDVAMIEGLQDKLDNSVAVIDDISENTMVDAAVDTADIDGVLEIVNSSPKPAVDTNNNHVSNPEPATDDNNMIKAAVGRRGRPRQSSDKPPVWYVDVNPADIEEMAAKNSLAKLTVKELKSYLLDNELPLTGNKPDLVSRITEHCAKISA